ncbi:uncharacterized protein L969DRAFT_92310 [Mixia osmundae IAM 14324]|uniref:CSC1/OSCA1-like 7TM region domain-containing protein n=1 Tax=Mixia osmundae (strain CBS 9802 / IAM 14324 / JCM 22182 / KY 12970) TaxID=764103 RepID=G7DTC4_MIXOS|nr:uncharacterized protein L969DRAFT_92310 [Mixia osmundae IAM 14324]KEI42892.1 hypothetical protein L969DRAFT_92310 [Mixia osmundae IAM 14324]GAA93771.1 hypothetical protein E5Q_00417 [Mixia osmundae IAM 14324]
MATLQDKVYSPAFTGLLSTVALAGVIAGLCTGAFETLRRMRRKTPAGTRLQPIEGQDSVEDYEMGYLYQIRCFAAGHKSPRLASNPLLWIWQTAMLTDDFYVSRTGMDAATYVRWIRGCWYIILLHLVTVFVILMPLHLHYAPPTISQGSMARASLSSLVLSPTGINYLWVHTVLMWWVSLTWMVMLIWLSMGVIRHRRKTLDQLALDLADPTGDQDYPERSSKGAWKYRTVVVSNLPAEIRQSERTVADYFETSISRLVERKGSKTRPESSAPSTQPNSVRGSKRFSRQTAALGQSISRLRTHSRNNSKAALSDETTPQLSPTTEEGSTLPERQFVTRVVLVRRTAELLDLCNRREETLHLLEAAHLKLVRNIMDDVALQSTLRRASKIASEPFPTSSATELKQQSSRDSAPTSTALASSESLVDLEANEKAERERLVDLLYPFLPAYERDAFGPVESVHATIYDALHTVSARLLDRYQPTMKLKLFKNAEVASIDYLLTKLNLLSGLIEKHRATPEKFQTSSLAFVTFSEPKYARLAKRKLGFHLTKRMTCRVEDAPHFRDLQWDRVVRASFSQEVLRTTVITILFWIFTIIYILPVSAIVALVSVEFLSQHFAGLNDFFLHHSIAKSLVSSFVPTILVAALSISIPPLIMLISIKSAVLTMSRQHKLQMARYWKWLVTNLLVFFCIGTTAITALVNVFTTPLSVLELISSSFPQAAVFYTGWAILVTAVHQFIELAMFGLPMILHSGLRKAQTPRKRLEKSLPRSFNYSYFAPLSLLVMTVFFVFCLLNPLVIAFIFVYFSVTCIVVKNQLCHVYWRRYYEGQGRVVLKRVLRYSCDGLFLAQFVLMAFFWTLKKGRLGGAIIPLLVITVVFKLVWTRVVDLAHYRLIKEEAALRHTQQVQTVKPDEDEDEGESGDESPHDADQATADTHSEIRKISRPGYWHRCAAYPKQLIERTARAIYTQLKSRAARLRSARPTHADVTRHADDLVAADGKRNLPEPAKLSELVSLHPKLLRDDRPRFATEYEDPCLHTPLSYALWLPRDPLGLLHLDNTVIYHGNAFVSSEGGTGELRADEPAADEGKLADAVILSEKATLDKAIGLINLDGTEQVVVPLDLPTHQQDDSKRQSSISATLWRSISSSSLGRRPGQTVAQPAQPDAPAHGANDNGASRSVSQSVALRREVLQEIADAAASIRIKTEHQQRKASSSSWHRLLHSNADPDSAPDALT